MNYLFNSDVMFQIGTTHKVCEDYGLSNRREDGHPGGAILGKPFIIISDGCSGANKTDFGARFLSVAAAIRLYKPLGIEAFAQSIITAADAQRRACMLEIGSLCSTIITAKVQDDHFITLIFGDGAVAAKRRDGTLIIKNYEFKSGAPYYLRYELDETKKDWSDKFGLDIIITTYIATPDGEITKTELDLTFDLKKPWFTNTWPLAEYEAIFLFSDGAAHFSDEKNESIPIEDIIIPATSVKNYRGEFLQRRINAAFKKTFGPNGWKNEDDFSVGSIYAAEVSQLVEVASDPLQNEGDK